MRKGKVGVLPETISVATAAEFLGGPQFVAELLHMISDGDLFSWTHGPSTGPLLEKTNHRIGTREKLPRITLDTPPETVVVITEELKGLFYHYDVPWPPGTGKASSWDGAVPLGDLVELATSRKNKTPRASWTNQERECLLRCFEAMGGHGKRGALAQLVKELNTHQLQITSQSIGPHLKRAEEERNSSAERKSARPSVLMQDVWVRAKPGRG